MGHEAFNDLFGSTPTAAGGLSVVSKGKHPLGLSAVSLPPSHPPGSIRKLRALLHRLLTTSLRREHVLPGPMFDPRPRPVLARPTEAPPQSNRTQEQPPAEDLGHQTIIAAGLRVPGGYGGDSIGHRLAALRAIALNAISSRLTGKLWRRLRYVAELAPNVRPACDLGHAGTRTESIVGCETSASR